MELLALDWVVSRGRGYPQATRSSTTRRIDLGWLSFHLSFHPTLPGATGAHWLDDVPDLSSKNSARQHAVDDPLLSCNRLLRRFPGELHDQDGAT